MLMYIYLKFWPNFSSVRAAIFSNSCLQHVALNYEKTSLELSSARWRIIGMGCEAGQVCVDSWFKSSAGTRHERIGNRLLSSSVPYFVPSLCCA